MLVGSKLGSVVFLTMTKFRLFLVWFVKSLFVTLMVPTLFLLELLPYGLCLTGLQCLRIKRIFHGLIYVKMEEEQVKRPSSQEGDISSTD